MDVVQITRELEKPLPAETVNGLLRIAQTYIRYAIDASNETIDGRVSDYVMIAHASAATAQSMILAEMTTTGTAYSGEQMRVLMTSALN